MRSATRWLLLTLLLVPPIGVPGASLQELQEIRLGETIEARLAGGDAHTYVLTVRPEEFFQVVIDQGFMDLETTVVRPDGTKVLETLGNIAAVYSSLGEKRQALEYYERSLALRRRTRDWRGQGTILNNMGVIAGDLGETQRALDLLDQALPLFERAGDQAGAGGALINAGASLAVLGEGHKALHHFGRAVPLLRAGRNGRGEARALTRIGDVRRSLGDHPLKYFIAAPHYAAGVPKRRTSINRARQGTGRRGVSD